MKQKGPARRSQLPAIKRQGKHRVSPLTGEREAKLQEEEDRAKLRKEAEVARRRGRTVHPSPLTPDWDSGEAVSKMRERRIQR